MDTVDLARRRDPRRTSEEVTLMIDLTEDQMLGMARIAGLHIPDEDVGPLTLRLNALLEASEALDQFGPPLANSRK